MEVDVVKIDENNNCVGIKRMFLEEWLRLKKQQGFSYRAYQIGFHSFSVNI